MIKTIGNVEFWTRDGVWCRPSEYFFGIDTNCHNKCIIIDLWFCGITILRNECRGNRNEKE